jgi:predicted metal-dependent hydrolase
MNTPHIDEIIRSRRKSIALIVKSDGTVIVRAPLTASRRQIMNFVNEKAQWIQSTQEKIKKYPAPAALKKFIEGEQFWYLGKTYPLQIVNQIRPALVLKSSFQINRTAVPAAADTFKKWYQQQARKVITKRVEEIAKKHSFTYKQIRITSARTRWGSCSSRGSINFTWRLVMAPIEVIDYVVLHELVHTKIHNHSSEFWAQVSALCPDFQQKRLWLKINGHHLTID